MLSHPNALGTTNYGQDECRYDYGGYFVINGSEKAVISQVRSWGAILGPHEREAGLVPRHPPSLSRGRPQHRKNMRPGGCQGMTGDARG